MSKPAAQRIWLYLLIVVYVFVSIVFTIKILNLGEDATGPLTISILVGTLFFPLVRRQAWAKWTFVIIFIALAGLFLLNLLEEGDAGSVFLIAGYLLLAYMTFRFKIIRNPVSAAIAPAEDVLDSSLVQPSTPENIEKVNLYRYPLLLTRYKALLIDAAIFFVVMITMMVIFGESAYRSYVMVSLWVLFLLFYEPVLTCYSATLGQRVMNIRVRRYDDPTQPIHLWQAYLRVVVKAVLGWVSFLSIHMNDERRAIHDLIGLCVMIEYEPTISDKTAS